MIISSSNSQRTGRTTLSLCWYHISAIVTCLYWIPMFPSDSIQCHNIEDVGKLDSSYGMSENTSV